MTNGNKRVAVALGGSFEDIEATSPIEALQAAGATVTIVGVKKGEVKGKKGASLNATHTFSDVSADDFDLLLIPGGGGPENLRVDDAAVKFTRQFAESGKAIGAICHGPQLLISADVLKGRTLTSVNKVRDDIKNAGGSYVDEPLVVDGGLITSRIPDDLPVFNEALVAAISEPAMSRS